jgi:hypothetical protein
MHAERGIFFFTRNPAIGEALNATGAMLKNDKAVPNHLL